MAKEVLPYSFLMALGPQQVHIPVTAVSPETVRTLSPVPAMTARAVSGGEMKEWSCDLNTNYVL